MTRNQWKALERYVAARAKDMGIDDTIEVSRTPCEEDNLATTIAAPARKAAIIAFCHNFKESVSPEEQREVVVHELAHVKIKDLENFVEIAIKPLVSSDQFKILEAVFDNECEQAVDIIARLVAPQMPLIRWPKR